MWKYHDVQIKMLVTAISLLLLGLIVFFTRVPFIALIVAVVIAILFFLKQLDLYMNLDKHATTIHNLIKYPMFIDNRIWLHHENYKNLFAILEKFCKANKTKLVLLRMQLDEIEQIKHKSAEDSEDFKNAKGAIDFIEDLQKKGVLTIRGIALKRIIEIEGEDDSDPKAPEPEKKEIEEDNPLAANGADFKSAQEGRWKSRLAEGIKNIINDPRSANIKQINLMSETPEIRVRVRAYVGLVKDRKVEIVDIKKATTAGEYLIKNTPKTAEQIYNASAIVKAKKAREAKKKAIKAKIDYVIKQ